jgi:tetratricopeptide (TPR) repeat protein
MVALRDLRVRLALALQAQRPDDEEEALDQLRRALQEPAGQRADWEIHRLIGDALRRRDDRLGALMAYSSAVAAAPGASAEAADAALELVAAPDGAALAASLRQQDVDALTASVKAHRGAPEAAGLLGARVHHLRGDVSGAIDLLEPMADGAGELTPAVLEDLTRALVEAGRSDDALAYLDRLGPADPRSMAGLRAWTLLEAGRFEEALQASDRSAVDDPATPVTKALAMLGLGRAREALDVVGASQASLDAALAEAVIRLGAASRAGGTAVDEEAVEAADRAASVAAHLERGNRDVLLVRAQVLLEGCRDADRGRRLLVRAAEQARGDPRVSRWIRFQQRARADDAWFAYFQVELAAACQDDDQVLALAAQADRSSTAHAQDVAMDTLVADVHRRMGRAGEAARALTDAASSYDRGGDLRRAVEASRQAVAAEATPERALDLTDYLWRWTGAVGPSDRLEQAIDEALVALDRVAADMPPGRVGPAVVMCGLLLGKKGGLATRDRLKANWPPLPWLLLAALLDPAESYWATHLAWAFNAVSAYRASLHFAERAIALLGSDPYPQEAFLACHYNYYGRLDARAEELAGRYEGDLSWRDALMMVARLASGLLDGPPAIPDRLFDVAWARRNAARVTALRAGSLRAAETMLRAAREEAERPPVDWLSATGLALLLGDLEDARMLVGAGLDAGDVPEDDAVYARAAIELVATGGTSGEELLAAHIAGYRRPLALRWVINVEMPLLRLVPDRSPGFVDAVERLIAAARRRLDELPPPPPLPADAEQAPDPGLRQMVGDLLQVVELTGAQRWSEASAIAARLAGGRPHGLLGVALRQLDAAYLAREAEAPGPAG